MPQESLSRLLTEVIAQARRHGAVHADAIAVHERTLHVEAREGKLERIAQEERIGVGLRAFVEQQKGLAFATASISSPSQEALAALAERTVAMARAAAADPEAVPPVGAKHPDKARIAGWLAAQPEQTGWTLAEAREAALALDAAARAVRGVRTTEGATVSEEVARVAYAASDGFAAEYPRTRTAISVVAVAENNGEMQRDYAWHVARTRAHLPAPETVGHEAGQRAIRRLGARPPRTGMQPVVLEPRVAAQLLGHYAAAANGLNVLRKRSFWADKLGEQVAASQLTIVDDPMHPEGVEDRIFDGEGTATRKLTWLERGVLKSYFTNRYAAQRLAHPATGHAVRGLAGDVGIAPSNLVVVPGAQRPEEILAEIQEGVWITELFGFGVNPVSGDFSFGAAGFAIRNGALAEPIQGMTIAGNLMRLAQTITHIGRDLTWFGARAASTIAIERLAIAGR